MDKKHYIIIITGDMISDKNVYIAYATDDRIQEIFGQLVDKYADGVSKKERKEAVSNLYYAQEEDDNHDGFVRIECEFAGKILE